MSSTPETDQATFSKSVLIATQNSPIVYGLGVFGLESAYKAFTGFYIFYYVDELRHLPAIFRLRA